MWKFKFIVAGFCFSCTLWQTTDGILASSRVTAFVCILKPSDFSISYENSRLIASVLGEGEERGNSCISGRENNVGRNSYSWIPFAILFMQHTFLCCEKCAAECNATLINIITQN